MVMFRFLMMRVLALAGMLLILTALLFTLQEVSGADPIDATMQKASEEAKEAKRAELGLDGPVLSRYANYVGDVMQLDLGTSFRTNNSVMSDLGRYLPPTIELVLFALVIAVALALVFAISSVLRWPGSSLFRGLLFVGSTMPTFLLGIIGLLVFYQDLGWLPASGNVSNPDDLDGASFVLLHGLFTADFALFNDALLHLIMPAIALAIGPALAIGRILRSSIITTLESDHVRTARAKGLNERTVLMKHVLRNSVNGALSMTGLHLGYMFAGVLIVESVFSRPGLGTYLGASLGVSDFPAVAGVTFVLASIYIISNTLVDVLQGVADPRIRVGA